MTARAHSDDNNGVFFLMNSIVSKALAGSMRVDAFFLSIRKRMRCMYEFQRRQQSVGKGERKL